MTIDDTAFACFPLLLFDSHSFYMLRPVGAFAGTANLREPVRLRGVERSAIGSLLDKGGFSGRPLLFSLLSVSLTVTPSRTKASLTFERRARHLSLLCGCAMTHPCSLSTRGDTRCSLFGEKIGSSGAAALAAALRKNNNLTSLKSVICWTSP